MIFLQSRALEDVFINIDAIIVAFVLLVFLLIYSLLSRMGLFKENKGINIVISLILAILAVYNFNNAREWFSVLEGSLLFLAVGLIIVFVIIFYKFLRKQF